MSIRDNCISNLAPSGFTSSCMPDPKVESRRRIRSSTPTFHFCEHLHMIFEDSVPPCTTNIYYLNSIPYWSRYHHITFCSRWEHYDKLSIYHLKQKLTNTYFKSSRQRVTCLQNITIAPFYQTSCALVNRQQIYTPPENPNEKTNKITLGLATIT